MNYFDQAIQSIENSDLAALQNAISREPQLIRQKNSNGQTLLLLACLIATQDGAILTEIISIVDRSGPMQSIIDECYWWLQCFPSRPATPVRPGKIEFDSI